MIKLKRIEPIEITTLIEDDFVKEKVKPICYQLIDDVFTTIAVHKAIRTVRLKGQVAVTANKGWVATETRTGFAVSVGKTKEEAAENALLLLRSHGKRKTEAVIKRQVAIIEKNSPYYL